MKAARPAFLLLAIQLVLVLSIAGKYLYERHDRPRVLVRAAQFDPNQPLRGRYLALQLLVDACALPEDASHFHQGYNYLAGPGGFVPETPGPAKRILPGYWTWNVSLEARGGHLVPVLQEHSASPDGIYELALSQDKPCDRVPLRDQEEFFIPDRAKGPFPLKPGVELWVEVTLPPTGPPRPIQIALSNTSSFQPLHFE